MKLYNSCNDLNDTFLLDIKNFDEIKMKFERLK
jgi:hypothetical protein